MYVRACILREFRRSKRARARVTLGSTTHNRNQPANTYTHTHPPNPHSQPASHHSQLPPDRPPAPVGCAFAQQPKNRRSLRTPSPVLTFPRRFSVSTLTLPYNRVTAHIHTHTHNTTTTTATSTTTPSRAYRAVSFARRLVNTSREHVRPFYNLTAAPRSKGVQNRTPHRRTRQSSTSQIIPITPTPSPPKRGYQIQSQPPKNPTQTTHPNQQQQQHCLIHTHTPTSPHHRRHHYCARSRVVRLHQHSLASRVATISWCVYPRRACVAFLAPGKRSPSASGHRSEPRTAPAFAHTERRDALYTHTHTRHESDFPQARARESTNRVRARRAPRESATRTQ